MVAVLEKWKKQSLGVLIGQLFTIIWFTVLFVKSISTKQHSLCLHTEYIKAWASCPIIIKRGDDVMSKTTQLLKLLNNPKLLSV